VNILDRFEHSFERLIEGSVGRIFRSPIQPAEIGLKLEKAMISNQMASVDGTLVPNEYRVAMNPLDMVLFEEFVTALCRQSETWLTDLAADRRFTTVDRMRVQIIGDPNVAKRAIKVTAAISDRPNYGRSEQDAVQRTELFRVLRETKARTVARLSFISGPASGNEFKVRPGVTTIGRALENDIVLQSGDVSRHHARMQYADGVLRLEDLNSTNGTRVNGQVLRTPYFLKNGDEIVFGASAARIAIGSKES
jgi:hypothetical protein